jgi:serine/threonine-protein kinase
MSPGARLGAYEVIDRLGAGGMGEVYRARDSRLARDVAIKVLPAAFSYDAERMGRFQREATVLASLNHPNIACIYGLEEHEGLRALIIELVDGEDLSQRLRRGPIPLEEAIPLARQITDALEYAHERGIVHRDLKPANIMLNSEGRVKVLDFGLAKAMSDESVAGAATANSPTLTMTATRAGIILGTAAYMSPEQAKGKPVDRRADIWAFGVVLYDVTHDGQRFLVIINEQPANAATRDLQVVTNWFEELKRRAPPKPH